MHRHRCEPRDRWQARVEEKGLVYHTMADSTPYWNESAYYELTRREVDILEEATLALDQLCLEAAEHVVSAGLWNDFRIPAEFVPWIQRSWEHDDHTIYGRFDLLFDGSEPPRLCEYNADTPTALLEAAIIQWFWLQDTHPSADQFNSIHERLLETFALLRNAGREPMTFVSTDGHVEDYITVSYLRDLAVQSGMRTQYLTMDQIGWNAPRRQFVDLRERPLEHIFKLYPWEWLVKEEFGGHFLEAPTRWLEPPWKMLLSNKALLPLLWELFPDHPNLLRASWQPLDLPQVRKPIFGREGANIAIVNDGEILHQTDGPYGGSDVIYQEYFPTPLYDGLSVILGSWLIGGAACGLGIREDDHLITTNTSRFVPHLFM